MACELYLNNTVIKKEHMQERQQRCGKMETTDLLEVGNWKVSLFFSCYCCFNVVCTIKCKRRERERERESAPSIGGKN